MTNEEFAQRVGCHHSMASRLRAGKRLPGADLIDRIAQEFNIEFEDLYAARRKGSEAIGRLLREQVFEVEEAPAPA